MLNTQNAFWTALQYSSFKAAVVILPMAGIICLARVKLCCNDLTLLNHFEMFAPNVNFFLIVDAEVERMRNLWWSHPFLEDLGFTPERR